jgi:hypothetical protein
MPLNEVPTADRCMHCMARAVSKPRDSL